MPPRQAWEACGQPNGEAGIQNIRRRGLQERKLKAARQICFDVALERDGKKQSALEQDSEGPPTDDKLGKGKPQKGFRLKPSQLEKVRSQKLSDRFQYDAAYIAATTEWHKLVTSGKAGGKKDGTSAQAIAERYAATLPVGSPKLTARSLYNAYRDGRCGQVCPKREASTLSSQQTWFRLSLTMQL